MPRFGAASSEVRIDVPRPVSVEAAPATCWRRKRDGGEARVMGIAGGGRHPVYSVQFVADVASRVTGGVDVACRGGDRPCSEPMADRIAPRRARLPSAFRLVCGSVSPRCARRSGGPHDPERHAAAKLAARLIRGGHGVFHAGPSGRRRSKSSAMVGRWRRLTLGALRRGRRPRRNAPSTERPSAKQPDEQG